MKQIPRLVTNALLRASLAGALIFSFAPLRAEEPPAVCKTFKIDDKGSEPLHAATAKENCKLGAHMKIPVPDPACTPGAINPSVTTAIVRDSNFTAKCLRKDVTSQAEKETTYAAYAIARPANNEGQNHICELDHLVPLQLGGADTLDNVWPQCGPPGMMMENRYFKEKNKVEDYLLMMVKIGKMELGDAQKGIAADWTQYSAAARKFCMGAMCRD